jgi:sterol desaturase/sphingolipid hydroxylase (fatty acid hydroxylase superfamily)
MGETLATVEPVLRLGVFLGVFVLVAAVGSTRAEAGVAFHARAALAAQPRIDRAERGESYGWWPPERRLRWRWQARRTAGVCSTPCPLPSWATFLVALVLLDLAVYFQHVVFHAVPALWRLHRVHHADADYDVTTGLRFHPVEILLSLGIKCAVIAALGAPVLAVLVFEVLLNAASMFNHANARLPLVVDRWLRWFVVTPDMHRVHHSVVSDEMNSNFGFNLPWWDRLFGTYRGQPAAGHEGMRIGVNGLHDPAEVRLSGLLTQPLREVSPAIARTDQHADIVTHS